MVNLTQEESLLQKIEELATNGKIQSTVRLTAQDAESSIKKLVQITQQRFNAAKFYFNAIQNMDSDFYLGIQVIPPTQLKWSSTSKTFVAFKDNDFDVQISILNNNNSITLPENTALIVFIVLNGFFSNLVSLEDYVAETIKVVYDLNPSDEKPSYIRQALDNQLPKAPLTAHLRAFHAIGQDGKLDKTGSAFNIAREIRNQLMHDDIDSVMISSFPIALSGSSVPPKLHFHNSFFSPNTDPATTEMTTFCENAYDETVNFIDECYRLIHADLQQSGVLPIP